MSDARRPAADASSSGGPAPAAAASAGNGEPAARPKKRSGPRSRTSPFVGVTQYKRTGNWEAHIWIQGTAKSKGFQRHLGSYETAEGAARVYDRAALKLRGGAAELNFPREEYAEDEFLVEHERTEKFRFLDLLRQRYSIQTSAMPRPPAAPAAQPRPRRGTVRRERDEDSEEEEEGPESPRTRTVHRVPRTLAPGPQRVTVHVPPPQMRLDGHLPPAGGLSPGSGLPASLFMGSHHGLHHFRQQQAGGRGSGATPAVSEELLISTAPLSGPHLGPSSQDLPWPLPTAPSPQLFAPSGVAQQALGGGSAGGTPCSSPTASRFHPSSDLPMAPELHLGGIGEPPMLPNLPLPIPDCPGSAASARGRLLLPPHLAGGTLVLQSGEVIGLGSLQAAGDPLVYDPLMLPGLTNLLPYSLMSPGALHAAAAGGQGSAPADRSPAGLGLPSSPSPLPLFAPIKQEQQHDSNQAPVAGPAQPAQDLN